jgi:hypothetical protein
VPRKVDLYRWREEHVIKISLHRGALGTVAALALTGSAFAANASAAAGTPVRVPDNPLGGSDPCKTLVAQQEALGSKNFPDAEVEPYVAVDPTNSNHLITSVQQDRWNDGGSNGLTNAVSTDGGATWTPATTQPPFSICEGATSGSAGDFNRATDPWVSFSSDGKIAYSISDSFNANGPGFGGASSIIISRSTDGGTTWQPPVTARVDTSFTVLNDKESVTGDPVNATTAYAVWDRLVSPSTNANPSAFPVTPAFRGPAMFSKTTDGGVSWSAGRPIFDPGEKNQTIGNQIVVPKTGAAKGQLIDGFDLLLNRGGKGHVVSTASVAIIRSTDGGNTWSGPTIAAQQQVASVSINGERLRTSDELPEFAAGPEGNLYAVWQDRRFTGHSNIAFTMSTDGGATWSAPIRIDSAGPNAPAFIPQVTTRPDGTIAVQYYDLEAATGASPDLTDQFIVTCPSATKDCSSSSSWSGETRLSNPTVSNPAGSFNILAAPKTTGGDGFVGDYDGLAPNAAAFDSAFVMATPSATNGPTDLFSNTGP